MSKWHFVVTVVLMAVLVIAVVFVLIGGDAFTPAQEKIYAKETAQMKKIEEHQRLQLTILQLNAEITRITTPQRPAPAAGQ